MRSEPRPQTARYLRLQCEPIGAVREACDIAGRQKGFSLDNFGLFFVCLFVVLAAAAAAAAAGGGCGGG
eukprot:scaffold1154_cov310-Pinguiococcus_pyrenoidosus.AAC.17